jgi:hypothetical protein
MRRRMAISGKVNPWTWCIHQASRPAGGHLLKGLLHIGRGNGGLAVRAGSDGRGRALQGHEPRVS